jgi:trehalose-6-phosphatase
VLAIGDDVTDEDLFRILPENAYSIRVGLTSSYARFHVYGQGQVLKLLREMAGTTRIRNQTGSPSANGDVTKTSVVNGV